MSSKKRGVRLESFLLLPHGHCRGVPEIIKGVVKYGERSVTLQSTYNVTISVIVYRPTPRYGQRTLVVQGVLYMWGGLMDGLPSVHDEYDKFECTSYINIFSVTKGVWEKKRTTGKPPLGVYKYGCAAVKKKLYYFGGWCGHEPIEDLCDGYHNSINVLDTTTLHWQQLSPTTDDSPMRRADCRMISFTCDNEDLLFIIGGNGVVPAVRQPRASYRKLLASIYYTNECNIFSPTTGK